MSRPMSRSERKKAFMKEAEKMFDEIDAWYEQNPDASFEEIESLARESRRKMMGKSLGVVINGRDIGKTAEAPRCEQCKEEMIFKEYRKKTVYGVEGDTRLEGAYYVCEKREGKTLFPPRQEVEVTS